MGTILSGKFIVVGLARIMHRFLSRSDVGASRWLATSGSPEQFGWQNRSHTGKECAARSVRVSHRLTPTGTLHPLAGHTGGAAHRMTLSLQ